MTLGPKLHRDPVGAKGIVPIAEFERLGRMGPNEYMSRGGREYIVDAGLFKESKDISRTGGALVVSVPHGETLSDGEIWPGTRYRRAVPVPNGTFAALDAKDAKRRRARVEAKRALRLVNILSRFPYLGASSGVGLTLDTPSRPATGRDSLPAAADVPLPGHVVQPTGATYRPGRPAIRTTSELIAFARKKGVELYLDAEGSLCHRPAGYAHPQLVDALYSYERLIVAELTGVTVLCSATVGCRRPAVALVGRRTPPCGVCDGVNVNADLAA